MTKDTHTQITYFSETCQIHCWASWAQFWSTASLNRSCPSAHQHSWCSSRKINTFCWSWNGSIADDERMNFGRSYGSCLWGPSPTHCTCQEWYCIVPIELSDECATNRSFWREPPKRSRTPASLWSLRSWPQRCSYLPVPPRNPERFTCHCCWCIIPHLWQVCCFRRLPAL